MTPRLAGAAWLVWIFDGGAIETVRSPHRRSAQGIRRLLGRILQFRSFCLANCRGVPVSDGSATRFSAWRRHEVCTDRLTLGSGPSKLGGRRRMVMARQRGMKLKELAQQLSNIADVAVEGLSGHPISRVEVR